MLVEKLEAHLQSLDEQIKSLEAKKKRQERQEKYALSNGINPDNIIACEPDEKPVSLSLSLPLVNAVLHTTV